MTQPIDPANADITLHATAHGYRVEAIIPLADINARLYRLVHLVTGARHVHISRDDAENTFGVVFKTVPQDSTGVAHILEHTVLCGSRKYPVRDPFFSMLKRSLSTFMNAFTASDWTMYPFATQNTKDYYNLMDVYLDAAFFPKIDALSFKQEGCRLEFEATDPSSPKEELVYKGVVYNEMKGAMSSPDQVMGRSLLNALYPDTTYSYNSGGDPEVIPRLTHDQLKAFHQRHYHPSNAYFYTYGNLPLADHLAFIEDRVMRHFEAIDPRTTVAPQPRWTQPRTLRYTYPLAPDEDTLRKSQACLAWLACDIRETYEVLVLAVLEQILLGNAGSPLRKTLMDSGLGSALCDVTGFDADNRDTLFACGLKDVNEENADQIEGLVMGVLQDLVDSGIESQLIDSAIHQIEFHRREITNTPYPYGLRLLLTIAGSWLHGGNPERVLQLDADFKRLREEIEAGPFLEAAIKTYLLDNTHRVRMVLAPDVEKSQKEQTRVREELAERERNMAAADRAAVINDARRLKALQESHEDIACLPTLALSDIPPDIQRCAHDGVADHTALWRYVQPTSGIFYFTTAAGAAGLSDALMPWVPFFSYAFSKIGTTRYDYVKMARRIDAVTGGLGMAALSRMPYDGGGKCLPMVALNTKCLTPNLAPMVAIVEELIGSADFGDDGRIKQLLGEYVAGLESMVVQNGHRLAILLSARTLSPAGALSEMWSGIHQLRMVRDVYRQLDRTSLKNLCDTLAAIAEGLFQPDNVVMAAVGEQAAMDQVSDVIGLSPALARFGPASPAPRLSQLVYPTSCNDLPFEGWSTSAAVAFVAQTQKTVTLTHVDAPALAVLAKVLRSLYLHRELREKGGAYGGFALFNPENGLFSLASYRDPHVVRTLDVYAGIDAFLKDAPLSDEDVKEAILQVCSEIDKPDPPGPTARKAFNRMIVGLNDEVRQTFKQNLLTVSRDRIIQVAGDYAIGRREGSGIAVIAGKPGLEAANAQMVGTPLVLRSI